MATQISLSPYIVLDRMLQRPGLLGDDDDWTSSTSVRKEVMARGKSLQGGFNSSRANYKVSSSFLLFDN